jgi:UDP-glucose 6-dehydrogenase
MNVSISISLKNIVDEMRYSDRADLIELIKQIDKMVAEYDFTAKLRDYFVEEMRKEDKEAKALEEHK